MIRLVSLGIRTAISIDFTPVMSSETSVQLPLLTATWLQDLFGGPIPGESRATCSNCTMCRQSGENEAKRFRPDVKCCSFFPHLPNFALGGVLNDTSSETDIGRASVEARIAAKIGVTPFGLDAPPTYALLYTHADNAFGVSRALRCPHYIEAGGLCGIWRYRNSVCSTYYCQVVRGSVAREFWQRLLHLLGEIESSLEHWCVEQLDIGTTALKHLLTSRDNAKRGERVTAADIDSESDPALYRQAWGDTWIGREREFYVSAARLVSALSWSDVLAICGPRVRLAARLGREAYDDLVSDSVPDRLRMGRFGVIKAKGGFVQLQGLGSRDQLVVLAGVVDVLPLFDGQRATADIRAQAKRSGTRISNWTVQQLVDFKILEPA
jgi:hypothetical protein